MLPLRPFLLLAVFASLALPGPRCLTAQGPVSGRVTDAESGAPVAGAVVELRGPDGVRLRATLTDPAGAFDLRGAPEAVEVRVVAMGYATRSLPLSAPAAAPADRLDVRLVPEAIPLEGITVTTGSRCGDSPGLGPATAELWSRVRTVLDAAAIARDEERLDLRMLRFERSLRPDRRHVLEERMSVWRGTESFQAVPVDTVRLHGFVQAGGGRVYYDMPTPDVILSDAFLDGHCFHVRERFEGGRRLLGLGFLPSEDRGGSGPARDVRRAVARASSGLIDRRGADVEGTLWVDAAEGRLEALDFRWVGLHLPEDAPEVGGHATFELLPGGLWIVRRWVLRMPTLEAARRGGGFEVTGLREEGGEVLASADGDGELRALTGPLRLSGRVVVDSTDAPFPGASVRLSGTVLHGTTGPDGRWAMDGAEAGPHLLVAHHPLLDSLALPSPAAPVHLAAGVPVPVLRLPDRERALEHVCPGLDVGQGHLLVRVRSAAPLSGVDVSARPARGRRQGRRTDLEGRARFCGLPTDGPVEVVARWRGGEVAGVATFRSGLAWLELVAPEG